MKKTSRIVSLIMFLGITIISFFVYLSYSKVIKDSTRNISELTTMNIYSEIHNELTKPIYVSFTMASDTFLESWLDNELTEDQDSLTNYLEQIKENYEYNSTFLISSSTNNYYNYDGVLKTVSEDDAHDVWYYSFLENTDSYELDVDLDEASGILTIFINVKMYDESNNVSAVVGVGLEMEFVQAIMLNFEENYDLSVYLIDPTGLVQGSSNTDSIETLNIFTELGYDDIEEKVTGNKDDLVTISEHSSSKYIISRYIDEIDWYILVVKDTKVFSRFFLDYFYMSLIVIAISITAVSVVINKVISNYREKVSVLANQDYLTLLFNRRGFIGEFNKLSKDVNRKGLLFMSDIDNFKKVNDIYGHNQGDLIIKRIANIINSVVGKSGKVSRWGGDEFTGFLLVDQEFAIIKLKEIQDRILNDEDLKKYKTTLSIGYAYLDENISLEEAFIKCDKALYLAKSRGGNKVVLDESK
ncbi:sensor domain-containing diguanylate cyclase [Mycoplasmatota bacterium WC30]